MNLTDRVLENLYSARAGITRGSTQNHDGALELGRRSQFRLCLLVLSRFPVESSDCSRREQSRLQELDDPSARI